VNLETLRLGRSFRILMQTTPILLVRLGAYLIFWALLLMYLGLLGGIAYLLAFVWTPLAWILVIAGLLAIGPIWQIAYQYVFYLLKAAYIAVVTEIIVNGSLPGGEGQLAWGRKAVEARFGQVSAMFVVDELVDGVVRAFTRTVYRITSILPGDTLQNLAQLINRVIRFAMSYIDEAIMARSFWRREQTVWHSAQDGVVLYAMVWKPILTNAVVLMILSYLPFVAVLLLLSAPVGFLVAAVAGNRAGGWTVIVIFLLAFLVKKAIGDAFAMTAIIASYYDETKDLKPSAEMSATLEGVSDQFRELKNRAAQAISTSEQSDSPPTPHSDLPNNAT
jgi:hypothetical protein